MSVGALFLECLSTGVITPSELAWLTRRQESFSRLEEATALRLGRLLDQGSLQLGCRLTGAAQRHRMVREQWIEPLGRRRHRA